MENPFGKPSSQEPGENLERETEEKRQEISERANVFKAEVDEFVSSNPDPEKIEKLGNRLEEAGIDLHNKPDDHHLLGLMFGSVMGIAGGTSVFSYMQLVGFSGTPEEKMTKLMISLGVVAAVSTISYGLSMLAAEMDDKKRAQE